MSRKDNKYAVTKSNILVHGLNNTRLSEQRTALLGTVVKIENVLGNGNVAIRFLDKTNTSFEDLTYWGKQSELTPIAENLWPILNAIPSPLMRAELAANTSLCDQLISMQPGTKVEVLHNKTFYMGVIRYIGPVQEMGAGSFFGLELLVRSQSQVTSYDGSYAGTRYFNALPGTGLFVSLDKLKPVLTFLSTINKKYEVNYPAFEVQIPEVELRNSDYMKEKKRERASRLDNDVDLIELLGGSWPEVGEKKASNINEHSRAPRNKSMNIMSHLINPRKSVKVSPKNENISNASTVINTIPAQNKIQNVKESEENSASYYDTPTCSSNLTVGTLVEVSTDISDPFYGVIRWVGNDGLAGVELEEDQEHLPLDLTDGTHKGQRYFTCAAGRALFIPLSQCQKDSRFPDDSRPPTQQTSPKMFGKVDSPIVPGAIPPLSMPTEEDVLAVCGKFRGIQGHHNSCYLDATLFAMFTYTSVFDSLLFRPRTNNDIPHYEEVQRVLREEIVNPLRHNLYVRADRVMKLRTLLEELSSVSGLTSEEKDPEEFLNSLLAQILKAEPFLKLSSGQEAFHYQLFVEKDEGLALPSVQQLFEQSFLSSDIKLKEVPSCLIIQMPRFGKSFKMYPRILPSQLLDVTDIIENSPRQCTICGKLAQFECRECFGQCGDGLESTGFCGVCLETAHSHGSRTSHSPRPLTVPQDFAEIAEHCPPPRLYMELFAVVCIETSHYVAFVKCGSGHEAPWCFFDSMADRKGEQNGYNIPEMVACPDVSNWLSEDGAVSRMLHEATPHDKQLPEHARRLLCDAYICMYQSPDVMMYR